MVNINSELVANAQPRWVKQTVERRHSHRFAHKKHHQASFSSKVAQDNVLLWHNTEGGPLVRYITNDLHVFVTF